MSISEKLTVLQTILERITKSYTNLSSGFRDTKKTEALRSDCMPSIDKKAFYNESKKIGKLIETDIAAIKKTLSPEFKKSLQEELKEDLQVEGQRLKKLIKSEIAACTKNPERRRSLEILSAALSQSPDCSATATEVRELIPTFNSTHPLDVTIHIISKKPDSALGVIKSDAWSFFVGTDQRAHYSHYIGIAADLRAALRRDAFEQVREGLESQKQGFVATAAELKSGGFNMDSEDAILDFGRALRAQSIDFTGLSIIRA